MNQERRCSIDGCPAYRQSPLQSLRNAQIDLQRYISLKQNRPDTIDEKPVGRCYVLSDEKGEFTVERGKSCGIGKTRFEEWYGDWMGGLFGQEKG